MKKEQLNELLYQALETEAGGVQVYETAIRCAINADLKEEWKQYLAQTRTHEQIMRGLLEKMGLDSAIDTPGRQIVRHKGESLVDAMKMALKAGDRQAAQLVAAECVVTAETKAEMKRVLDDIQSGRFTRDWMLECKAGQPSFKATRRLEAEHPIEEVGERLRGMMPWIGKNRLVDKSKN